MTETRRVMLVTGSTDGIGRQTALELCRRALDRFESSSMPPSWGGRIQLTMAEVLWKLDRRDEARHELGHAASNLAPDDPGFTQAMVRWLEVGESPVEWAFKIE